MDTNKKAATNTASRAVADKDRADDGHDSLGSKPRSSSGSGSGGTVNTSNKIEFEAAAILEQVVCTLCDGLFKQPYTTIKCYHTFCKSCLVAALFSECNNNCPKCDLYMGRSMELSKLALPDRTLEALIDHVFFPNIARADRIMEAAFYKKRGIARKSLDTTAADATATDGNRTKKTRTTASGTVESSGESRTVCFRLVPHESSDNGVDNNSQRAVLPRLECSNIETQESIRIGQLKTYLMKKLRPQRMFQSDQEVVDVDTSRGGAAPVLLLDSGEELEILCHSVPLGNELSVKFIARTVWMDPSSKLTLTYR